MRLEGILTTFPMRELVEMIMYSSVTGVLEIHGNAGPSRLFFNDGRPYHAVCGPHSGLEAMRELFVDPEARFLFIADITTDTETLWMDPIEMLDHCEARALRLMQLRQTIPSLSYVPLVVSNSLSPVNIAEDDWPLLSVIDGQRTITEIAAELSCDVVEVCESFQRMIERGQVRLNTPSASAPHERASVELITPQRGLLDRLLDSVPDLADQRAQPAPVLAQVPAQIHTPEDDPIVKLLRNP